MTIEMIATLALVAGFFGLIFFLYKNIQQYHLYIRDMNLYIRSLQDQLTSVPTEMQKFYTELSLKNDDRLKDFLKDTFKEYLKHIQQLEKMTLPKVVSEKEIQHILDRTGPIVENEIEQGEKGIELNEQNLSKIPFDQMLNVQFDQGDDLPTTIE